MESRPEGEKGIWVNTHAGEELALYVRYDLGLNVPILIYTGEAGIIITRYIKNFSNAGSTRSRKIIHEYIEGLVGKNNNMQWAEFDAGSSAA
jgi:hypothetical protein